MSSFDMSTLQDDHPQAINFRSLEELVNNDDFEDTSTIKMWCEKLQNFKLEGNESPYELKTLVNGLSYLMSYTFATAEELKEVAERETIAMAEREEQWEEEKQELKEELESLRERITARADAGESSEAFRAQINSLKEENRTLQQMNRDRDRQMADQSDRFEALVARVDALTRERDTLIDYRAQAEDTISELRRRIFAKSEESTNEWETKKLKLRNEQAVTLSRQMQAVASQNDELRGEVEKVSTALEEATRLIESSSTRINLLKQDLEETQKREADLAEENIALRESLEEHTTKAEKLESETLDSTTGMKNVITKQQETIDELKDELKLAERELVGLRERIAQDISKQKEQELEKLKDELIEATKMARRLFGEYAQSKENSKDPMASLRIRLVQLENQLQTGIKSNNELKKDRMELEEELVKKDHNHASLAAEVERLRDLKFGDARQEVNRLEGQLKIRDSQLSKLTNFCTMLQIELGRYAEKESGHTVKKNTEADYDSERRTSYSKHSSGHKKSRKSTKSSSKRSSKSVENNNEEKSEKQSEAVDETHYSDKLPQSEVSSSSTESDEEYTKKSWKLQKVGDFEQQAMLISSLYYEIMKLLEENGEKNRQLLEMEYIVKQNKKVVDSSKEQLKLAYTEIRQLKEQSELSMFEHEHETTSSQQEIEEVHMELKELKEITETIRMGGSDMERKLEEVSRKLISEKMQTIRLERSCAILRARVSRTEEASRNLRDRILKNRARNERSIASLQYELDTTCIELAKMQHRLIHSVPLKQFDELSLKYRKLIKREIIGSDHIENNVSSIDFQSDTVIGATGKEPTEEQQTKVAYLKKLISVLTDQNEFWSKETELLQNENDELKKFMEDIENESDLKSVLAAIEHRLLFTIREQQETVLELQRETRRKRDADEQLAKNRLEWSSERKKFIHIITILQKSLQQQRNSNMASFTLEQMEKLKEKIAEARNIEDQAMEKRRKAEEIQDQLEKQYLNQKSMIRARNQLSEDADRQRIERMLQTAYTNVTLETAKAERLQSMMKNKDNEVELLREQIILLEKENEEKLLALICLNPGKNIKISDVKNNSETKKLELEDRQNVESVKEETDYEMDFDSSGSSEASSARDRLIIKTVVQDNSTEFKQKLEQMKRTAETAIRGYKEQLAQKDAEVASYRELLLVKMNEPAKMIKEKEIVMKEYRIPDSESEQKLKNAAGEIARLKEEVEELQLANHDLYKQRQSMISSTSTVPKQTVNISVQTEDAHLEVFSGSGSSRLGFSELEQQRQQQKSQASWKCDDDGLMNDKSDITLKFKSEIRHLQERVRKLTSINRELMTACEKIKNDAMEELEAKRQEDLQRDRRIVTDAEVSLRMEGEKLKQDIHLLKKKLVDKDKALLNLAEQLEKSKKDTQEELSKWNERKKMTEKIETLQKKLKESYEVQQEFKNRLERREKHLEQIRIEEHSRMKDIDKLNRQMKEMRIERESSIVDNQQILILKDRLAVLNDRLHSKEQESFNLSQRIRKLEKEKDDLIQQQSSLEKSLEQAKKQQKSQLLTSERVKSQTSILHSQSSEVISKAQHVKLISDRHLEEQLKETRRQLRLAEIKFRESDEKLQSVSDQHNSLANEYSKLVKKLASRDERSTGAVAVLGDKLQAKDKEISSLKSRILILERRLSQ